MITLEEFLKLDTRNLYVKYRDLVAYMRKNYRYIDGSPMYALDLANIKNVRRVNNFTVNPNAKRTGQFADFDALMKRLVVEYGFDGIYVENVLNPFLPNVLLRYGYTRLPVELDGLPCFWWQAAAPRGDCHPT